MKKVYSVLCLLGISLMLSLQVQAQGNYFTQNNFTPLLYNPAAPAVKNEMGLWLNYRHLQSSSQLNINAFTLSAMRPLLSKDGSRRWGGVGLHVLNDKAEDLGSLTDQHIAASFAYNARLTGKTYVAMGMQVLYGQHRFGLEGVTTGNQWVANKGYDPTVGTGESFGNQRRNFWSLGSGLMLYQEKEAGGMAWQLGFSAFDMNQPIVSFTHDGYKRSVGYKGQFNIEVLDRNRFAVIPEILYQTQVEQDLWSIGSVVKYKFANENPFDPIATGALNFIARTNIKEAVLFGIQLEQPNYVVGFSYDWGFATGRTNEPGYHATEFAFSLRKSIGGKRKKEELVQAGSIGEVRDLFNENKAQQPAKEKEGAQENEGATTNNPAGKGNGNPAEGGKENPDAETAVKRPYVGDGLQVELKKDFRFGFNEATLDEEDKAYLDEIYELLYNNEYLKLKIIGHTDNVGTRKANSIVSERRARVVEEYLISKGIAADRISSEGKGDAEPLVANDTEENRAKNRRVEFILYTAN